MSEQSRLHREELEQLEPSDLVERVLGLEGRVQELEDIVLKQAGALQALQDQVAKDSRNSSKPPSSDGLQKRRTQSLRKSEGRKPGGQAGHKGETLLMVDEPDYIKLHRVDMCPHCQSDLSDVEAVTDGHRQVFDIPAIRIEVTEHQVEVKTCPRCQQRVEAAYPADVGQRVQYGPRLKAQASYLNSYQLLPMARTCELFGDFYSHVPSTAFVIEANRAVRAGSQPTLDTIQKQLQTANLAHFDESGLRVQGQTQWLHSASTDSLTYYAVHPKRGRDAMNEIGILPNFRGRAVHDHWKSYETYTDCQHIFCNSHHLRELQFVIDQYQQAWASEMFKLLLDIKAEVDNAPTTDNALPQDRLDHFEQRYDALLKVGFEANPPPPTPPPKSRGRTKQSPPKNLLDRLDKHKAGTLAFMYDFSVPFDNNLAERDIRMIKVKQKISGAFRTEDGAKTFCDLRSYISTARKQGHNVIKSLFGSLTGSPFNPASELIL
jgi:transposase